MTASRKRPIRWLETVDSTNREAAEWARAGAASGSAVVADEQVSGRGRLDRTWYSPKGEGLFISVIIDPPADNEAISLCGLAAAVAVHCALSSGGIEASVKWPNDVLIGDRKVAGILSEAIAIENGGLRVVIGIGVNVGMSTFPEDLSQVATSLLIESGLLWDRQELLDGILTELDQAIRGFPDSVLDKYRPVCSTIGRNVRIVTSGGSKKGIAVDVDERGALVMDDGSAFLTGDVIHLR